MRPMRPRDQLQELFGALDAGGVGEGGAAGGRIDVEEMSSSIQGVLVQFSAAVNQLSRDGASAADNSLAAKQKLIDIQQTVEVAHADFRRLLANAAGTPSEQHAPPSRPSSSARPGTRQFASSRATPSRSSKQAGATAAGSPSMSP